MATTFGDVSKSSATNHLFLCAQRTLAHQNEPPTPPPLNVVGLPCQAMCLLWARLHPEKTPEVDEAASQAAEADPEEAAADMAAGGKTVMAETVAAETVTVAAETVGAAELKAAATKAAADRARSSAGSVSSEEATQEAGTLAIAETSGEEATAEGAPVAQAYPPAGGTPIAQQGFAYQSSVNSEEGSLEMTFAKKIAKLANKITKYIINHQDDAVQEFERETAKNFRMQREAFHEAFDLQREEMQKVKMEVQSMQHRFDHVHSKLDETTSKLDETIQLVRNLANGRDS